MASASLPLSARRTMAAPRYSRPVALDWGLAETMIAIDAPLLGVGESAGYREWVAEPRLPDRVAELGLRSTPSLDFLAAVRPDVILSTPQFAATHPVLEQIAPVLSLATYTDALTPYRNATAITRQLGSLFGREEQAEALITKTEARLAEARSLLSGTSRPTVVVVFHDETHLWVFGEGSLFADVLEACGVDNAWKARGNAWGIANATLDQLAVIPESAVLVVEPVPPIVRTMLRDRDPATLIGAMDQFAPGAYRILPPNWGFGALASAGRFADALVGVRDFLSADHDS